MAPPLKSSIFKVIFFILLASTGHAYQLEVRCGPDGDLKSQEIKGTDLTRHLQTQIKRKLRVFTNINSNATRENCDTSDLQSSSDPDENGIALISELNSRARIWSTRPPNKNTWFDKEIIEDIAKNSLKNDIDPYVALAISIIENPPYTTKTKSDPYDYGRIGGSVNSISIIDEFGCKVAKNPTDLGSRARVNLKEIQQAQRYFQTSMDFGMGSSPTGNQIEDTELPPDLKNLKEGDPEKFLQLSCFADPTCKGLILPGKNSRQIDLSRSDTADTETLDICFGSVVDHPSYPLIMRGSESQSDKCCAKVVVDKVQETPNFHEHTVSSLLSNVFFQSIKNRIQNPSQKAPAHLNGVDKISWLLQGYNGRGHFPLWSDNQCLAGLDMNESPVYGATVGDMMLNMLITNPDLEVIIAEASSELGKPQKSLICSAYGAGVHQINSQDFARLEKSYLSGDAQHTNRLQKCANNGLPMSFQPWTDRDAKKFLGE